MKIIAGLLLIFTQFALAEKNDKIYTEEEFQKKLSEEVIKKVATIKTKSVEELTKEFLQKE
jgi:ABC-type bacteriocin/lantibiotic exporter with double-glycine peptidase domain